MKEINDGLVIKKFINLNQFEKHITELKLKEILIVFEYSENQQCQYQFATAYDIKPIDIIPHTYETNDLIGMSLGQWIKPKLCYNINFLAN